MFQLLKEVWLLLIIVMKEDVLLNHQFHIQELMDISAPLAELNYARFHNWHTPFDTGNARPAVLAFKGDVYIGMQAETFTAKDFDFAQQHLRILSGLDRKSTRLNSSH